MTKAKLHSSYMREEIPALVSDTFNRGKWLAGHLTAPTKDPKYIVLLVTLNKKDMAENYSYKDGFRSNTEFNWQSQNSTSRDSGKGSQLINHKENNLPVLLFVRASKKIKSKAAPFTYCGELELVKVRGDKPMSVNWILKEPLTDEILKEFRKRR